MSSRRSNRRVRRARSTVLGAVIGLIALNVALAAHLATRPGVRDPMFDLPAERYKARRAAAGAPPTTVVFLGSSRTGHGIRPSVTESVIAADTGDPCLAYNLHVPANGPIGQRVHWQRLLDRDLRPDVAVLEITPFRFTSDDDLKEEMTIFRGDRMTREEVRLVQGYGYPDGTKVDWREANLNPWFGFRIQILSWIHPKWLPNNVTPHEWGAAEDLGWKKPFYDEWKPENYAAALAVNRRLLFDRMQQIRFDATPAQCFRDLILSCLEHGTVPAAFVTPEASAIRAWYPPDLDARLAAFLDELRGMGVFVADGRAWLPDEAFHDGHHAVRLWSDEYTRKVTQAVVEPAVKRARATRPSNGARVAAGFPR